MLTLGCLLACGAAGQAAQERSYPLANRGALVLTVPAEWPQPDGEKLKSWLRAGRFADLDATLAAYQDAYRAGAIDDEAAAAAFAALTEADPDLRAAYDQWVSALPASYVARMARGFYLMQLGYLARGSDYSQKTPPARIEAMRADMKAAMEDLEASLKLDSMPVLSYGTMIAIAQAFGARAPAAEYLDAALALDPKTYTARASYFATLQPQWGGSLEQMQTALSVWKRSMDEAQWQRLNARLEDSRWRAQLQPYAQLVENKQYQKAIEGYSQVLSQAEVARAYAMRGYAYAQLGDHAKAIADMTRALALDPDGSCCSGTRSNRARSYLRIGAKDKALEDLLIAARQEDAFAARELAMIYAFGRHGFKRDYGAAKPYCERAAKQGDGLAMYCLGSMYHAGLGTPKDSASAAYWMASAAVRGVADAQADVGFMYWQGEGVAQDRERAAQWWRIAASKGNKRAAAQLRNNSYYWSYFRYVVLADLLK
jgi:TPR repeat protein